MATCKDCVFWLKCLSRISYIMDYDEITGKEITDIEKRCNSFKDKSRYVEVVRCKDCKRYELMTSNNQHFCNKYGGYVNENDYCSRCERRCEE